MAHWVKDNEALECAVCRDRFGVFVRRHHCRACGKVVCDNCSKTRADLTSLGFVGPQRVCKPCRATLPESALPSRATSSSSSSVAASASPLAAIIKQKTIEILKGDCTSIGEYPVYLRPGRLDWDYPEGPATPVFSEDVMSIQEPKSGKGRLVMIHSFPMVPGKSTRKRRDVGLLFPTVEEAQQWKTALSQQLLVNGGRVRRVKLFVNPFGGTKKAVSILESIRPTLNLAHIELEIIETQYEGHAKDVTRDMDMSTTDAIVCCSGDGVLCEVVNGVMSRADWNTVVSRVEFGIIPAGSGNGLAKVLDVLDPMDAAFLIGRGRVRPLDLIKIVQDDPANPGQKTPPVFSFLSVNWGIISDVDFESEHYRFLGNARFTVGAVVRLVDLRRYRGFISYKPVPGSEESFENYRRFCSDSCNICNRTQIEYPDASTPDLNLDQEGWVHAEGDFVLAVGCNVSWISSDVNMAPYAHLSDGNIDLLFVRECERGDLISMFLDLETGKFVNSKVFNERDGPFQYHKVSAFKLEPRCEQGSFGVDGERIRQYSTIYCSVVPSALRIIA